MSGLLFHELLTDRASSCPHAIALEHGDRVIAYAEAAAETRAWAQFLRRLGVGRFDRVGVYLPMQIEAVTALFGASLAGAVFVPIIPMLRPAQAHRIVLDSGCKWLITTAERLLSLRQQGLDWSCLSCVIVVGELPQADLEPAPFRVQVWRTEPVGPDFLPTPVIDADVAALLYTSGSTGAPKGVVLSHRNLVCAARSSVECLDNRPDDRLLVILALGFDYGLSQVTSAFACGACAVLFEYLTAADIVRAVGRLRITGLATVPSVWIGLAAQTWPPRAAKTLRYGTNSAAALPQTTLLALRAKLPHTGFHLMYGLTEAFCSTCLLPQEIEQRPGSVGRAMPQAEVAVLRDDGSHCRPGERGELVHRGGLVALGYWRDPVLTAVRFRPWPHTAPELPLSELAVWSGDEVSMDAQGYLYFHGRRDELVKVGGVSVHPLEVERAIDTMMDLDELVAVPLSNATLGTVMVVLAVDEAKRGCDLAAVMRRCQRELPSHLVPRALYLCESLPHTASGKVDRTQVIADVLCGRLPGLEAASTARPAQVPAIDPGDR